MKRIVTNGIVLGRLNFGEADRIITVLTSEHGKLRLMAKGARRQKSKLAGGIELLSINSLTFIPGRREISTLVSSRLVRHFASIVSSLERTTLAYQALAAINKSVEDNCEPEFFELAETLLKSLDNLELPLNVIECWFYLRLLSLLGHAPNLNTDTQGVALQPEAKYNFDFSHMAFTSSERGAFTPAHVKLLRLLLANTPQDLQKVNYPDSLLTNLAPLVRQMVNFAEQNLRA